MMVQNYQKILDDIIRKDEESGKVKRILLHACCAPCSSYCLEYLSKYYEITVFFYNPNITGKEEYEKRAAQLDRFVKEFNCNNLKEDNKKHKVEVLLGRYEPDKFFEMAKGHESDLEGGSRCRMCYAMRLEETALQAQKGGFDYFSTTLSISPYKNAVWLNELGRDFSKVYSVAYLYSDFKKKNGYKRSIELSAQYDLYRQDYCGCVYSKVQAYEMREKRQQQQV